VRLNYPIDKSFFCDLVLQRTGSLTRIHGFTPIRKWLESGDRSFIEAFHEDERSRRTILEQLEEDIYADVDSILSLLPINYIPDSIVSIGPGNAILETFLLKHYWHRSAITLIDIEHTDSHHHGYKANGAGYASLEKALLFMTSNGLHRGQLTLCNPRKDMLPNTKFCLLISILSMGFHFPLDSYAEYILTCCTEDGLVIFDKRKGIVDNGYARILDSGFHVSQVTDLGKAERILLSRRS